MQALKGTHDILPDEVYKWDYMEGVIRDVCARYGYKEIRTPIIEATELFQRGIGDRSPRGEGVRNHGEAEPEALAGPSDSDARAAAEAVLRY